MTGYLRFTPSEYRALRRAARSTPTGADPRALQAALAAALRAPRPALARRIASLGKAGARILHRHLRDGEALRAAVEGGCALSVQEWQEVARASAAVWLRDNALPSFQGLLVAHLRPGFPALAGKLDRLSAGQVATLYRRLRSGRRWCP